MKANISRRNILIAGGGAAVLAAAGLEVRHLLHRHAPSPYDALLAKLDDRDAAAQIGEGVLAEIDDFEPKAVAKDLRASFDRRNLTQASAEDAAEDRLVEANGWVLPKTLALLCGLAAKAQ